ncbi:acyl-CoA dehydrogenase family protein [Chelatococcus reniformis]|uniref:Acyl-CoA dehydrogenase n=1 Tax=Chelatococcus reniformis TaxID=1494448 RepID=A0A916USV6_9HYPH|nr:acyl-CoA dehydrogenase family protein [Chelatococcus reniformis]GGC86720.1 putative acyl-CoA dehydrogenase [Chelatococcus reniformis]
MSKPTTSAAFGFEIPAELTELADRIGAFVRNEIIPYENDPRWGAHGPSDELRRELNALARKAGVFAPHSPEEFGGLGLGHLGRAASFIAAGYSMLGPIALHCAAPDEGNIHLLEIVATPEQRERYLKPLASGEVRSCFCMTEPAPGAGSDPRQLATVARRDGDDFVISGQKWLITGAYGAAFAIIMARIEGGEGDGKATMFLSPMDAPGIVIERALDSLDSSFTGGHAVMRFDGLRVPASAVLGQPGQGLRYAQVRLAPARLTHCMRWLGSAMRAHDVAADYARTRTAFGKTLAEHEGISFMLADNLMDIHTARLTIWHAAWLLDRGEQGGNESSMAKVICSEAIYRVVDRSLQVLGGLGVTRDAIVERIFRDVRSFRIYDGPSEVHRWALGQRIAKGELSY